MHLRSLVPAAFLLCLVPVAAQTRATYTPFGAGCSGGATNPILYSPKLPVIGREFAMRLL